MQSDQKDGATASRQPALAASPSSPVPGLAPSGFDQAQGRWTPGPWSATQGQFPCLYLSDGGDPLDGSVLGAEEASANARLIAAAPALYEALDDLLYEDSDKSEQAQLVTRIKAAAALALALARGESNQ